MANQNLTVFEFHGNLIRFEMRGDQVWVCLTDMAKATGKRVPDWTRLKTTIELLQALESDMHIPTSQLIESQKGNSSDFEQGTWAIEDLAIDFAQWCNIGFRIWVIRTIKDVMRSQSSPVVLPPADIRVSNLISALDKIGLDFGNPRFKQGYQDLIHDILGIGQPILSGSQEQWVGVAERAEELGYSPVLVVKHRSQLGKWVKANGLESRQEKRLCNGTQRPINLYLVSDELDDCIKEFLDAKVLANS